MSQSYHMKGSLYFTITLALFTALLWNASSAEVTETDESKDLDSIIQSPTLPAEKSTEGAPAQEPVPGQIVPPTFEPLSLPARPPLPTPPALMLLPPLGPGQPKLPLSWRAKAYKLTKNQTLPAGSVRETFYANLQDTFIALSAALEATGLVLKAQFPHAGHLLAHMNTSDGSSISVIGVLREQESKKTDVILLIEPKSYNNRMSLPAQLFAKIRSLLERNKLL